MQSDFRYTLCEIIFEQVRELPGTHVVGWLKIDVRPLRHSLQGVLKDVDRRAAQHDIY